jgi:tetratricopeptide (TPR) repeat protein
LVKEKEKGESEKAKMIAVVCFLSVVIGSSANVSIGDEAFFKIDYPRAIASYEEQLQSYPNDCELLWRLARVYVCTGEVRENGEGEPFFKKAEEYARRCIRADSTKAEGHTWLAATLGYLALHASTTDQVRLTNDLHAEIEKALVLSPNDDAAYSIRGSFYRALANVGWLQRQLATLFFGQLPVGGFEEAETALKKAITLAPDVMRHHYELGVLYLDWDRREEAKKALEYAATLTVRVAIDRPRLVKVKELLAEINNSQ